MVKERQEVKTFSPESLNEALKIRAEESHPIPLAGGTDLMVKYRKPAGNLPAFKSPVMFIGNLDELHYIEVNSESIGKVIHIGSGTKLSLILKNSSVPEILKQAAALIAAPGIRNMATIGGNICNSSPAGDTIPVLYCLNAVLVLISENGEREEKIADFITGPGRNSLRQDELLKEIKIPAKVFNKAFYRKVGTRKANALSKLSFTGLADVKEGKITDLRIAFGAVAPVVVRSKEIEDGIVGMNQSEILKRIDRVKADYEKLIKPIDDQRSSAVYRKNTALKLLEYFLTDEIWAA